MILGFISILTPMVILSGKRVVLVYEATQPRLFLDGGPFPNQRYAGISMGTFPVPCFCVLAKIAIGSPRIHTTMHATRPDTPRMPPPQTAAHPMWGPGDEYLVAAKLRNFFNAQARLPKTLFMRVPRPPTALYANVQATPGDPTAPQGPRCVE